MSTNRRAAVADQRVEAGVERVHLVAAVALHRFPVRLPTTASAGRVTERRRRWRRRRHLSDYFAFDLQRVRAFAGLDVFSCELSLSSLAAC
jgi:hypothetical protein